MHLLDVEQRRKYLHEAKLQAKVEVVAYKSEATNEKNFNLLQQTRQGWAHTTEESCVGQSEDLPLVKNPEQCKPERF